MATRSEAPDLAVDELKRRARRRLVGAIVLALAAAVLLPLLLENEPKPLGDEVSIQIPPVDSSRFVNPLSPEKPSPPSRKSDAAGASPAPAEAAPAGAPAPKTEQPPAPTTPAPKVDSSANATPPPVASSPAPPSAATDTKPDAEAKGNAAAAAPSAAAPANAEEKPETSAAAPKAEAKSEAKSEGAKSGNGFVIQVAAFTDRYGALALVRKLKQAGFASYAEAAATDKGAMHRVRVGPYSSRDAAEAARVKLKAEGYDAIVARAQ